MAAPLTVVGLGPGDPSAVTNQTLLAMASADHCVVRTERHPSAGLAPAGARFLDDVYDSADTFDEVYAQVVEIVVAMAASGPTTYAVPGSPLVLERTVRWLQADERVEVTVLPALSFLDVAWARLGIDPVEDGVRLVDGHVFADAAAGERGPLLVAHTHANWVLSDIKLAVEPDPDTTAIILQRLGTPEEAVTEVAWADLDRAVEADHLTSIYIPRLGEPVGQELIRSVELMSTLRQNCPWDKEQTHQSLRPYLIEEAYEVLEALDDLPADADGTHEGYVALEEELGDLWFQVLFHSELAAEAGAFTIADVARTLHDKLVSRHPHVFGEVDAADSDEVVANWEKIKRAEKGRESMLDGIPPGLPALSRAEKVLRRADRSGAALFPVAGDAPDGAGPPASDGAAADLAAEDLAAAEVGRHLLRIVLDAYRDRVDPEQALRAATRAAEDRFRRGEAAGAVPPNWVLG